LEKDKKAPKEADSAAKAKQLAEKLRFRLRKHRRSAAVPKHSSIGCDQTPKRSVIRESFHRHC